MFLKISAKFSQNFSAPTPFYACFAVISEALNYDTFFNGLSICLVFFCIARTAQNTPTKPALSAPSARLIAIELLSSAKPMTIARFLWVYPKFFEFVLNCPCSSR
jgi:hypothetical protein